MVLEPKPDLATACCAHACPSAPEKVSVNTTQSCTDSLARSVPRASLTAVFEQPIELLRSVIWLGTRNGASAWAGPEPAKRPARIISRIRPARARSGRGVVDVVRAVI